MSIEPVKRAILPNLKDFKRFWQSKGPFKYALTSKDFPPVLLEPEEWIFSNDVKVLLKELMQFDNRKMKIVKAPFNPDNKSILRPEMLSPWKINHFPEEWNVCVCDLFVPEGHLTGIVLDMIEKHDDSIDRKDVEQAFFHCLESCMDQLGYLYFKPRGSSPYAALKSYLAEWEEDEQDAGLL
ncbi:hypothetical protein [Desulfobacula sp.]|uniref:hypothetical protein n=1 Tax=Desulfobacula sp. TaxID=2593537 RepID=UPI002619DB94|nr:hypothetical protein [Desulfobacula sp.]